jgi:hypothetical protein
MGHSHSEARVTLRQFYGVSDVSGTLQNESEFDPVGAAFFCRFVGTISPFPGGLLAQFYGAVFRSIFRPTFAVPR